MKTMRTLLSFILAGIILAGCNKASYRKTPGGMPYQVIKGGDTTKIPIGSFIKIQFEQRINDSVIFSTAGKPPLYLAVNKISQPYDLSEIWSSVNVGDSIVTTQMIDTFIKRNPDNIKAGLRKGDRLFNYVKVLGVFKLPDSAKADEDREKRKWDEKENAQLLQYLKEKNITAQKTPSGAYLQIIREGEGNPIDSGAYVTVNYTGTSFSGVRFDSTTDTAFQHTQPYSFTIQSGEMIPGFDEAVKMMKKGGVAKVYIPSVLAYGGSPRSPHIKPYESLIFDLEVVEVKADGAPRRAEVAERLKQKVEAAQGKK